MKTLTAPELLSRIEFWSTALVAATTKKARAEIAESLLIDVSLLGMIV